MYWTLYKNVFDKMKLRGVSKEPLSSPKSFFEILFEGDEIDFSILF
jgi:hypothetical protein